MTTLQLAEQFLKFCKSNPQLRFYQALYVFTQADIIQINNQDCFYIDNNNVKKPEVQEMTVEEISRELGRKIKVIGNGNK